MSVTLAKGFGLAMILTHSSHHIPLEIVITIYGIP